ncbi:MAG: hypothetical protein ACTHNU_05335 [Gaiellales bacterium]
MPTLRHLVLLGATYTPRMSSGRAESALYLIGILACALGLLAWLLWKSLNSERSAAGCWHEWDEPFEDGWGKRHRNCKRCGFQQHERIDGTWR